VQGSSRRRPKAKVDRIGDSGLGDYVDFQPLDKPLGNLDDAPSSPTSGADETPDTSSDSSFDMPQPTRRRPRRSRPESRTEISGNDFGSDFSDDF
jgi:hypothetical protein